MYLDEKREGEVLVRGKTFLDAAIYLETYGWRQGGLGIHGSARCIMGAIISALSSEHFDAGFLDVIHAVEERFFKKMSAPAWNDCPGRTVGEVTAKLREMAHAV